MRLNKWLAQNAQISRRQADDLIAAKNVSINGQIARLGQPVSGNDRVTLGGEPVTEVAEFTYVLLDKPIGYVCSHVGQGRPTIYGLLPKKYQHLKIAGRLDHDSSGLLLLTDNGDLILRLTHPRFGKEKTYHVALNHRLLPADLKSVNNGIKLDDGNSLLVVKSLVGKTYEISMKEGRNRQIRRTLAALGYKVTKLERISLGSYSLTQLGGKTYCELDNVVL